MKIDASRRVVSLGARELAVFGTGGEGGVFSAKRAAEGVEWHKKLAERATAESSEWRVETPVMLRRVAGRWTVEIDGRIDQWRVEKGRVLVREVKTVAGEVEAPGEFFRKKYRAHFAQLAVYCAALAEAPEHAGRRIAGEVLYADTVTGVTFVVTPDESPDDLLSGPLARVVAFAEDRRSSRARLSAMRFRRAHETSRDGHEEAREALAEAVARAKIIPFEAPTGFGKTAFALEFALARLRGGFVDRALYLTGKNSGRIQVFEELTRMVAPGEVRAMDLRSRDDHALAGIADDPASVRAAWDRAGFEPEKFFDEAHAGLPRIREAGERAGLPPWEITRAILPYAELIVADYNHVFSPGHAGLLAGADGFDLARTLLVVDEAHNLPERAAAARSHACDADGAEKILSAFEAGGVSRHAKGAALDWFRALENLRACERLEDADEHRIAEIAAHFADTLSTEKIPWASFSDELSDIVSSALRLAGALRSAHDGHLVHCPKAGALRIDRLQCAKEIGDILRASGGALAMSATLSPAEDFCAACGIAAGESVFVRAHAPWRDRAYRVIVDARADTRFRVREKHHATTARAVIELATRAAGPTAVFFPSYRYAEAVAVYVKTLDPGFRVATQSPGGAPEDHAAFVEEGLIAAHALFLVLGGGLAEGVDLFGDRVTHAMIVGPAIPDVTSPLNRARRARLAETLGDKDATRLEAIAPGIRKVNQALGRLVRGPGRRATVVLHCRRFAEAEFVAHLAPEYRGGVVVKNDEDFLKELRKD